MKTIRILILEDDLETLSLLMSRLAKWEDENKDYDFAITVLSEYFQVEEYINKLTENKFDIVLLDRDCKAGGSFHVLDLEKIDADKIISISSVPEYNEQVKAKGVTRVVYKDYGNLVKFADGVLAQIKSILNE